MKKRNSKMFLKVVFGMILTLFFSFGQPLFAQQIKIVVPATFTKGILLQLEGETSTPIDTVNIKGNEFVFSLKGKHQGFYKLLLDKNHSINFVNDGKDVELKADFNNPEKNITVVKSESNKLYYEFIKLNKAYKTKTELLNIVLQNYPKNDDYYSITLKELKQVQSEYLNFVNITSQKKADSFISRYIRSAKLPVVNGEKQLEFLKHHALDDVNFNDGELIYSDLFTSKAIEYLMYYKNPRLPKSLLEQEFQKAVDTLLSKSKANRYVYQQMTEYLIKGFTEFGFDSIINYIVDNYVIKDDLQIDVKLESSIQKRINQAKYFKIGSTVPNIVLPDTNGKRIDVSKIQAEKILILFYASWCPHCETNIPELVNLYNNQKKKKVEVVAVSIDTDKKEWTKVVRKNKMNFFNLSDLKGWEGKAARDYYIYATPTMFLIDNQMKIISKPFTINDVKKIFE